MDRATRLNRSLRLYAAIWHTPDANRFPVIGCPGSDQG
jgi:hypothetical protein